MSAYYLVHSLAGVDFAEKDRTGAHAFARCGPGGRAEPRSSTWAGWATTGETSPSTFAAGGRSNAYFMASAPTTPSERESSSATGASAGRSSDNW